MFDWPVAGLVMRWALRVAPSSGNLQTTEVHLVLPPLEGLAPVTAAQLGFNGTEGFVFLLIEMRGFHHKGTSTVKLEPTAQFQRIQCPKLRC